MWDNKLVGFFTLVKLFLEFARLEQIFRFSTTADISTADINLGNRALLISGRAEIDTLITQK